MVFNFLYKRHFSVASSSYVYQRWFHYIHVQNISLNNMIDTPLKYSQFMFAVLLAAILKRHWRLARVYPGPCTSILVPTKCSSSERSTLIRLFKYRANAGKNQMPRAGLKKIRTYDTLFFCFVSFVSFHKSLSRYKLNSFSLSLSFFLFQTPVIRSPQQSVENRSDSLQPQTNPKSICKGGYLSRAQASRYVFLFFLKSV